MNKAEVRSIQNKLFFLFLMIGILILSYLVLKPYLALALMAFLIAAIYRPFFDFVHKVSRSSHIATMVSVFLVILSILIPIIAVSVITANQVVSLNQDIQNFVNRRSVSNIGSINVELALNKANEIINDVPGLEDEEIDMKQITEIVSNTLGAGVSIIADQAIKIGSSTVNLITNFIVFIILLATFLTSHKRFIEFYERVSPLENEIDNMYIQKITDMGVAMIKGTLVIAIIQGLLTGLVLWIAGIEYVFFWTVVCIFLGIIPLGAGIVSVPIGIILMLTGNAWEGALVILSYTLVISNIDNMLRPRLAPKDAALHPALTLLGVLGGLSYFGPLGFIFGPMVMIFLTTTLNVYIESYKAAK